MGININDLDNSLNSVGTSLLSKDETMLNSVRELSDEELKICGGSSIAFAGGGFPVYGFPVYSVPVSSAPVSGFGGGNITFNVSSNSTSNSVANAYDYH